MIETNSVTAEVTIRTDQRTVTFSITETTRYLSGIPKVAHRIAQLIEEAAKDQTQ